MDAEKLLGEAERKNWDITSMSVREFEQNVLIEYYGFSRRRAKGMAATFAAFRNGDPEPDEAEIYQALAGLLRG